MSDINDNIFKYLFKVNVPRYAIEEVIGGRDYRIITGHDATDLYSYTAKAEVYWKISDIATLQSQGTDITISSIDTATDIEKYLKEFLDYWVDVLETEPHHRENAPYEHLYVLTSFYEWVVTAHQLAVSTKRLSYQEGYANFMSSLREMNQTEPVERTSYYDIFSYYHKNTRKFEGEYMATKPETVEDNGDKKNKHTITPIGDIARKLS